MTNALAASTPAGASRAPRERAALLEAIGRKLDTSTRARSPRLQARWWIASRARSVVGDERNVVVAGLLGPGASTVNVVNTTSLAWRASPAMPAGAPQSGHEAVLLGEGSGHRRLFVFGGQNSTVSAIAQTLALCRR